MKMNKNERWILNEVKKLQNRAFLKEFFSESNVDKDFYAQREYAYSQVVNLFYEVYGQYECERE